MGPLRIPFRVCSPSWASAASRLTLDTLWHEATGSTSPLSQPHLQYAGGGMGIALW